MMRKAANAITFIDLFAGIGGMRLGFEEAGAKCVFSSEWDKFAQVTYETNFGEKPEGDIRKIRSCDIPQHDILIAGFPCQPFSISGVSKKRSLGKPDGFDDPAQGTLFFEIKRILRDKRPRAFLLENVKNLRSHDRGRTYQVIMKALIDDLGYTVYDKLIDADRFVPQHRERIFIIGFRDFTLFDFPEFVPRDMPRFGDILKSEVPDKYTLSDHLWNYLQEYARKHRERGNGFGYGLTDLNGRARTLSARYYKDGSEILIPQGKKNPRRLMPRECSRLMGFPDDFIIPVSDTQAYRQFGNSVVVPVVYTIARELVARLENTEEMPGKVREPVAVYLLSRTGHDRTTTYFRQKVLRWGKDNFSYFPWRKTSNRWHALVAEILLQRTRAEQVVPVYASFCRDFRIASDYCKSRKRSTFNSLGLRWREKELRKLAKIISEKGIPSQKEELKELPGVGEYIASAYRSLHLGKRDAIIDSNVVRIYGRFFQFPTDGETRRKKWLAELSERITPKRSFKEYNYGLIDLTRTVCKTKPLCGLCPLRKKCSYFSLTRLK